MKLTELEGFPRKGDPRIPFSIVMVCYVVSGLTWMGFNRTPQQIFTIMFTAMFLEVVLSRLMKNKWVFPYSALISSFSLVLLLNYAHNLWIVIPPVLLTIASKYVFTVDGKHVYNPSLFGVVISVLFLNGAVTTSPAYQWNGTLAVSAFIVTAALVMFIFKINRKWLVGTFLGAYAIQICIRAIIMRHHIPVDVLVLGTLSSPAFYLFTFFMLTDPKTSPNSKRGQIWYAVGVVVVDLILHALSNVSTFFLAAFVVATVRYVILFVKSRRSSTLEVSSLSAKSSWPNLRFGVLRSCSLALSVFVIISLIMNVGVTPASAHSSKVAFIEKPAFPIEMNKHWIVDVDPLAHNVAKWVLSVGASAFVSDIDKDGWQDVLTISPLAVARDKVVLLAQREWHRFCKVRSVGVFIF